MKKIISLLLTVAMLMSILGIAATAVEGNAAVRYEGAYVDVAAEGTSWFNYGYAFIKGAKGEYEYVKRVNDSGADHYGGFNYTQVFDFKVTDYGEGSDHFTDFTFSNDITNYHYGYSFTHKAFVVYDMYMPGFDPNSGHFMLAKMSYDLQLDTWYEMTIRFVDKTITIYLNGVEMLVADLTYLYNDVMGEDPVTGTIGTWDWTARERPQVLDDDMLFFTPVDVDMYLDNMAFYSGDYDISTGTATTTYCTDSEFTNMSLADGANFCDYTFNENFVYDPNGGTEKVTYNRGEAAAHKHEWVLNSKLSSVQHCLVPGYDLYECANGCGASEQRNYVAPAGHLPGYIDTVITAATADTNGVENRVCTRDGCGLTYTTIVPLTDTTNGALHGYTDGGTSIYNGMVGIGNKALLANERGFMFEADIMPLAQTEGKDFAAIGTDIGGNEHDIWVGYKYNTKQYVIEYNDEIVASSDKAFKNYEWQKWAIVRDDLKVLFYVDGELLLSADIDPDIYTLTRYDEDGTPSQKYLEDCFQFVLKADAVELLLDNMIVAAPDFDFETRSGIIYSYMNFNEGEYSAKDNFIYNTEAGNTPLHAIAYNKSSGAGYKVEAYGRPYEEVTEIHQDRALLLDSNYEKGSNQGYTQLHTLDDNETGTDHMKKFVESGDLEFTFDFYAYDWCTDETLLAKEYTEKVTTTDPETGEEVVTETTVVRNGSAFIGSHVNSQGIGNDNNPFGNGFAGYDLIKQQVVIGSVSEQAGGYYGEDNTIYAPYTVEKETWHNMSIHYKTEYVNDKANGAVAEDYDNDFIVISVYMDGNLVLSKTIDYWSINLDYFIFYPNFVKAYFDNLTVKIGDVVYDDAVDFTNAYDISIAASAFGFTNSGDGANGVDWSIADGGMPTHVNEAIVFPASCLSDGYTTYNCSCGESTYTLYNLPATGHNWDAGVVTTPATGSSTGIMTYTCSVCGEEKTEVIEKLFTYGDVNNDGAINSSDVSVFKRKMGGSQVANFNDQAADVTGDGKVNSADYSRLVRYSTGSKVSLGPTA